MTINKVAIQLPMPHQQSFTDEMLSVLQPLYTSSESDNELGADGLNFITISLELNAAISLRDALLLVGGYCIGRKMPFRFIADPILRFVTTINELIVAIEIIQHQSYLPLRSPQDIDQSQGGANRSDEDGN